LDCRPLRAPPGGSVVAILDFAGREVKTAEGDRGDAVG
jgi:hypothetical protein